MTGAWRVLREKRFRSALGLAAILLLTCGGAAVAAIPGQVVPREGKVAGEGYAYYLARSWQIVFGAAGAPPVCDTVTVHDELVLVVEDGAGGTPSCDVAAGEPVYIVSASNECSTLDGDHNGFGTTPSQLELCARTGYLSSFADVSASLDGQPITNLPELLTQTRVFRINPHDGRSVAYGEGLLFSGFAAGTHVVEQRGRVGGTPIAIVITLHVH